MTIAPHLDARLDGLPDYPFARLAKLLGGPARPDSIVMSIGEPQHRPPALVAEVLAANASLWGKYPPANGPAELRQAVADWAGRRYGLPQGLIDPEKAVLPVAGTREALYLIAQTVCGDRGGQRPLVLLPNPFYQVYAGAAVMAGADPVFVPGADGPASQPDFSTLPPDILDRTALAYVCSPANPQGSVADAALLERQVQTARRHGFVLAVDECYSEIWDKAPPPGVLSICAALGEGLGNVLMFNSLSKRSSVPGLRSGIVVGDEKVIHAFARLRSYGGAATPLPIAAVAAALWRDEAHVRESGDLYRAKLDVAERILGQRFGFYRPAGGFFLWLDVGDGEAAAVKLWREGDMRVLPGAYLAAEDSEEGNPGSRFIRVALVHDLATTEAALARLAAILGG
ncbi:N-succinyl-L L-diaminopimelate aminotransferase alternative [Paramagnetospirillum magnetotacticum MS-1]|uniref:N-succinyl-L L-diaminopimelate aminotransferase alternative n=1 Tax=Paramagnetospirillum magnetotacticum MS-1 TaxID=272627 RepID=A0A0C2U8M6_PARME|nr:aminotransferase class I/II-fold pyridoxal phosphate-dependent enzyme [Paramagnetospirillum magnetotacticum]KIL97852.1 N-succinyl-L L-diaminopimelate aminotransferase alternative [Paramagnetospirillum magnetotacticum MS-1]